MGSTAGPPDAGLARERTSLSLDRTILSGVVACLLLARHAFHGEVLAHALVLSLVLGCAALSEVVIHAPSTPPAVRHHVVVAWCLVAAVLLVWCGATGW